MNHILKQRLASLLGVLVVAVLIVACIPHAHALDAFDGFVSIDGTFFDTDFDAGGLDAFQGQAFTLNVGDTLMMGGDVKTTPGEGATAGADAVSLEWKIFVTPNLLAPAVQSYGFDSNPSTGVDKWSATSGTGTGFVDLVAGLAPDTYTLEIYWRATDFAFGDSSLLDNSGQNYTATVQVVPEPASIAILAFGCMSVLCWRTRR